MENQCWLPDQIYIEDFGYDWNAYQEVLYSIFKQDFISRKPQFQDKQVNIRRHPVEFGKEEAFYHVTCQDYSKTGDRQPDFRRCERIKWVRGFIENYQCDYSCCEPCDGIKVWDEPYHNTKRVHLLLEEERYMVVLERRDTYCLLITAFYLEHDHALGKKLKNYDKYG